MKKQCPNCKSYKTKPVINKQGVEYIIGKILIGGGCLSMFFSILFPQLILLSIIALCIGGTITNARDTLSGMERLMCRDCAFQFVCKK